MLPSIGRQQTRSPSIWGGPARRRAPRWANCSKLLIFSPWNGGARYSPWQLIRCRRENAARLSRLMNKSSHPASRSVISPTRRRELRHPHPGPLPSVTLTLALPQKSGRGTGRGGRGRQRKEATYSRKPIYRLAIEKDTLELKRTGNLF